LQARRANIDEPLHDTALAFSVYANTSRASVVGWLARSMLSATANAMSYSGSAATSSPSSTLTYSRNFSTGQRWILTRFGSSLVALAMKSTTAVGVDSLSR
jgi:hypothetical protein